MVDIIYQLTVIITRLVFPLLVVEVVHPILDRVFVQEFMIVVVVILPVQQPVVQGPKLKGVTIPDVEYLKIHL